MSQRKNASPVTLNDFADLKKALREAARTAAAQREAERAAAAEKAKQQRRHEADKALFAQAVGPVNKLPDTGRVNARPARPEPVPQCRQQDEQAVLRESLSDEIDVDSLLETDESLAFRRPELGADVLRKLRRGVWALQGQIDLHGLRTEEARVALSGFLRESQLRGWRCVRVVHGKGLGSPGRVPVIKDKVKRWLVQSDRVLAFVQARGDDGGAGALIVLLQSSTPNQQAQEA
ncbi:MAG TPA: Smr/MutS family protein [Aquabacterium sp.]|uniref:Smr/MutS family protein n=1 Tax=Aquabacterium sp. TaxID=1872578 RepID=UPI002E345AA5|nr:Smr/MutS family protein [Aquabacterium sp.]HEX5372554.1 Smr/MutS family protein [Aquabacterium sp.]